jgi:TonB family protein
MRANARSPHFRTSPFRSKTAYNVRMETTLRPKVITALGWVGLCTITVLMLIATSSRSSRDMRAEALQRVASIVTNSPEVVPQPQPAPPAVAQPAEQNGPAPSRPRTIAEAMSRGGQHTLQATTPFGEYDAVVVKRIQDRWYAEIVAMEPKTRASGKVVVQFNLRVDGTVTDCRVGESTAPQEFADLCRNVISTAAPFPPFPSDMRRMVGADTRQIQFTFYYN